MTASCMLDSMRGIEQNYTMDAATKLPNTIHPLGCLCKYLWVDGWARLPLKSQNKDTNEEAPNPTSPPHQRRVPPHTQLTRVKAPTKARKRKKLVSKLAGNNDEAGTNLLVIVWPYLRLPTRKTCSHPPTQTINPKVGQVRRSTVSVAEYFG